MPNFRGNEDLCKLGKEYLNASLCKFVFYSLQHSETFDVSLQRIRGFDDNALYKFTFDT